MKLKVCYLSMLLLVSASLAYGQDTRNYNLRLSLPLFEYPQNITLPYHYPSMDQALDWSGDLYELSFWGIDELGDKLFVSGAGSGSGFRKMSNIVFKYALSLGFSRYGSELPIPLGVWGHEEFHRSVLGVNDISSFNGNWLLHRWDGTVYGISDESLSGLKSASNEQLLYSYVAGVQYEILLNERATLEDFYKRRSMSKAALLLYNAWYVRNYFSFATSAMSDSVKIIAPEHESPDPVQRDFAGADLTAWAYDMFNPDLAYTTRDAFPDGEGVNRRIGFSDLSEEARDYLLRQRKLSLLNFINPGIFFIERIRLHDKFSFSFFLQYVPTHFGNDVAFYLPVQSGKLDILLSTHLYKNRTEQSHGYGIGIYNYPVSDRLQLDLKAAVWNQPESFFGEEMIFGGSAGVKLRFLVSENLSCFVSAAGKTGGWMLGSPYLDSNTSLQVGLGYQVFGR